MKKAKVVNQANKQSRFLTGRKAAWLAMGAAAVLGAISVAVPTSHIPGFRYLAEVIGIGGDATRDLTMADFASYAVGTRDNKITALREANLLSYGGTYGSGGGLSPFSTFTNDRLAEAYAKNSKEAIVIEKSLSGSITPFKKDALDRDVALDPVLLAKGFDPTKISASSQAAHSGAMEALAAAAGKQAEMLGKPLKKGDLQGVASLVGIKDPNVSNIVSLFQGHCLRSRLTSFCFRRKIIIYDGLSFFYCYNCEMTTLGVILMIRSWVCLNQIVVQQGRCRKDIGRIKRFIAIVSRK